MENDECFIAADEWLVVVYFEPFGRQVATGVFAFEAEAREALEFLRTTEPKIRSLGRWSVVKAKASLAKRMLACEDILCLSAFGEFVFTKQPVFFPPKSGFYAEYEVHRAPGFDELAVATYKLSLVAEKLYGEEPITEAGEQPSDDSPPPSATPASVTTPKADEALPSTGSHPTLKRCRDACASLEAASMIARDGVDSTKAKVAGGGVGSTGPTTEVASASARSEEAESKVKPTQAGGAHAAPVDTGPVLAADHESILAVLGKNAKKCMNVLEVSSAGKIRNRETVGNLLKALAAMGLVHRPYGKRKGYALTDAGRQRVNTAPPT